MRLVMSMPASSNCLLPCDGEGEVPKRSITHARCSPDWPLTREQKKERVIQMYDKELRSVAGMVEEREQTLESTSDRVDKLSHSLHKIIAEASSVLGEVDLDPARRRSKSQAAPSRRKSLPTKSSRRSSRIRPQIKEEPIKQEPTSPRDRRISFGEEEPENEPTDGEDAPLLPEPVIRRSSLPKEHTQAWKCKFKAPFFADDCTEPCTTSTGAVLDVPDSFMGFCSEIIFGSSSNHTPFMKTD